MRRVRHTAVGLCVMAYAAQANAQATPSDEWTAYGHDALGSRYSPLTQITRDNVGTLAVAWTYRTGEMDVKTQQPAKLEATPLMVDGTLYLSTPFGRVMALDPQTGVPRWTYDAHADRGANWGDFANRGVSTWLDRRAPAGSACRRRIYLGTIDARIIALDSRRGMVCRSFGDNGTVRLEKGLRNAPYYTGEYALTSPPAVINGMIVTGSSVADNNRTNAASGEVRAYDARTGALRWSWDPVPRDSTDAAWNSWHGAMSHTTGAANAWSVIAADSARDMVFVPTGSPSPDYYGGERTGDNHYANSVVALRASTGKVVWHFQAVHHDLWDYDVASPPALVTITHDGKRVDVVLQATKTGQLFVLDRDTGVRCARQRRANEQPIAPRRSVHAHAWYAVCHAASHDHGAGPPALCATTVGLARRDRPPNGRTRVGRAARRSGKSRPFPRRAGEHAAGHAEPRRADCDSWRSCVHRRDDGSRTARLRHRNGT